MIFERARTRPAQLVQRLGAFFLPNGSKILYLFFLVLPFVDSLNGYLNNGGNEGFLSMGMLYRASLILYCLFEILQNRISKRTILILSLCTCLIILPHTFDLLNMGFLSLTVKTVLPILCIEVFIKRHSSNDISEEWFDKLLDAWSVLFPLVIIVPFVLGHGFQTYGSGSVGYKGFFYAQNDLCFALSLLFFFSCGRLVREISFTNVVKLVALAFCIALLGMKSGYLMLAVSVLYWFIRGDMPPKTKAMLFAVIALLGLLVVQLSSDGLYSVVERWRYFWSSSDSFLSFFSSGRIDRIPQAASSLLEADVNPMWILFGSGTLYSSFVAPFGLIEMDPFDLFFQYGLTGIVFFSVYYGKFVVCKLPEDKRFYRFALLMALTMSLLAGHVLNSALSSMVFAVLCGSAWTARSSDDSVAKHE